MRAMTNGALSRFNPAQPGAQGMKVAATGLLVVMAAVFVVSARARAAISRGSATSRRSPKRRWSAASPTGSR